MVKLHLCSAAVTKATVAGGLGRGEAWPHGTACEVPASDAKRAFAGNLGA